VRYESKRKNNLKIHTTSFFIMIFELKIANIIV